MTISQLSVSFDTGPLQQQIEGLRSLLERLPDGIRQSFLDRVANLGDFCLETETIPTVGASAFVLRFRSVALAELCAAASRALNGDGA